MNRKDDLIAAAKTILENAESMVGNERFQGDMTVTIYLNRDEIPRINIDRYIYPDVIMSEQQGVPKSIIAPCADE